jgi:hypothetical protein
LRKRGESPAAGLDRAPLLSDAQHVGQHSGRMVPRVDAIVDSLDFSLFVDEKTHALGIARVRIFARAVGERDRVGRVAQ